MMVKSAFLVEVKKAKHSKNTNDVSAGDDINVEQELISIGFYLKQ